MLDRRKCKLCMVLAVLIISSLLVFAYFCGNGGSFCTFSSARITPIPKTALESYLLKEPVSYTFAPDVVNRAYEIDIENEDVIVYLHIQKTGGSVFGRHLVGDLDLNSPCVCYKGRKRCDCLTKNKRIWLFSRFSTGWACGLHADWTELKMCVETTMDDKEEPKRKRRYHYISVLRDPVSRYLSEWKHVKRGATWKTALLKCNGRQASLEEVPFCFQSKSTWYGVSLDEFMDCEDNLAHNRQTRMLANLSQINCYNKTGMDKAERDRLMLVSAKENLQDLSFFGLLEYQRYTQKLFEYTFNLEFLRDFTQYNVTHASSLNVTDEQYKKIINLNKLDIELYQFAKDLFLQRVRKMQSELKNMGDLDEYHADTVGGPQSLDSYDDDDEVDENYDYHMMKNSDS